MLFTVVQGSDDGLLNQSEICSLKSTNCILTDDLSLSFREFLTQRDVFDDGR